MRAAEPRIKEQELAQRGRYGIIRHTVVRGRRSGKLASDIDWMRLTPADQNDIERTYSNIGKSIAAFERTIVPQPTRFDDYASALIADDHKLHLDCRGTGSPTVVLDAGLGGSSLDWTLVQPELATTTRVCAYDRAGMGWSTCVRNRRPAL